jgi:hypothetical protein
MLTPGQLLDDRYRIEHHLAEGGMAHVYAAVDVKTQARVAVKVMKKQLFTRPELRQRFVAEAMPAAVPAVVPLCGGAGVALAGWVVRTRRLVTARAALERWAGEVASGLRAALEERVLVAESALLEAHTANPTPAEQADAAVADPTVEAWMGELARVRAELDEGVPRIVGG